MGWYEQFVTKIPGVQGGAPVLRGTRTPVGTVVAYYQTYCQDRNEVAAALPHLTMQQIDAALAYYEHHKEEVDADEQRHEKARERFLKAL